MTFFFKGIEKQNEIVAIYDDDNDDDSLTNLYKS